MMSIGISLIMLMAVYTAKDFVVSGNDMAIITSAPSARMGSSVNGEKGIVFGEISGTPGQHHVAIVAARAESQCRMRRIQR